MKNLLNAFPRFRLFVGLCAALLAVGNAHSASAPPFEVVASFSVLGDLAQEVGAERIRVHTLVPAGSDAHSYQAKPSDAQRIRQADLILVNGLGFDDWVLRLAASAQKTDRVVVLSQGITPFVDPAGGGADPHAWHDVRHVQRYVRNLAAALARMDVAGQADYTRRAEQLNMRLSALDEEIRAALAPIPAARRKVVSAHDALGYFGRAYGIVFLPISGMSNAAEPSAAQMAALIRQVRQEKVSAIFLEQQASPQLVMRLQKETGARLGGALYADSLGPPESPAGTYIGMMQENLKALIEALNPQSGHAAAGVPE